jgi:hypothetical protein
MYFSLFDKTQSSNEDIASNIMSSIDGFLKNFSKNILK